MKRIEKRMTTEKNGAGVSRRTVLKGAALGGAGLVGGGALLSSCGKKKVTGDVHWATRGGGETGDAIAKSVNDAYTAKSGNKVIAQQVNSDDFQNNFVQIMQGTPDDAFGWMAGWRTNARADAGLLADVSDQIKALGSSLSAAAIQGATNPADGKQYIIPTTYYPWGLHYRKSMVADIGMDPESIATWDDFIKMCTLTQKKGLVGFALGDKGGWEAMGTFDIINARLNGYQFHIELLNGKQSWTDPKVVEVFKHMEQLIPFMNKNILDISWDGMRDLLLQKKCGAMLMGSWFANDFKAKSQADYDDLWIVPFPEINPEFGVDTIDAPLDGVSVAANGANVEGGKDLAQFWGSKEGIDAAIAGGDTSIYISSDFDTSSYDAFNKQKLAVLGAAKNIMFFLDRDTRGDFAGPVVGVAIQNFLKNPKDLNKILENTQAQWDALPTL
jgi:multiple sugar transport system substrate-binding protein